MLWSFSVRTHIVFFDIGDTIGEAVVSSPPLRLQDLRVFAYVPPLLQRLKQSGLRLGIISNTGPAIGPEAGQSINAVLASVGLLGFFDPALLIYSSDVGLTKDDVRIFQLAAARAGAALQDCLFVGEAPVERIQALAAGMRVAPHPMLAEALIAGESLLFVRVSRSDGTAPAPTLPALVALRRSRVGGGVLDAIIPSSLLSALRAEGYLVTVIGAADLPLANDVAVIGDAAGLAGAGDRSQVLSRGRSDWRKFNFVHWHYRKQDLSKNGADYAEDPRIR